MHRSQKKIQIITTEVPPLYCIPHFPSTIVMNFITWNKAYSLYPWTTFVLRTGVVTVRVGQSESRCLKKYREYHKRVWPYVPGVDESPKNPVRNERCVTDTFSCVVPLNTSGVAKPATPDYAIELSSWQRLVLSRIFMLWGNYLCDVAQISCDIFRHWYLCSGRWFKFVVDQIRGMQHLRRKMLIWKDADSGWWGSGWHSPNVLPPPIGCYCDDWLPKIYALYLEKENAQIKLQQQRDVGG